VGERIGGCDDHLITFFVPAGEVPDRGHATQHLDRVPEIVAAIHHECAGQ